MALKKKYRSPILVKAIELCGGVTALTERLNAVAKTADERLTISAVSQWPEVPPERCLQVEAATGISRYEQRPDIYGDPPARGRPSKRSEMRVA